MPNNLPFNILYDSFQDLERRDIKECQLVCHSWYLPANRQLLKYVRLLSADDIESFLSYIKENPEHSVVVKELELILDFHTKDFARTATLTKRLFDLKLNIKMLSINCSTICSISELNELILKAYPKLEEFYCHAMIHDISHQKLTDGLRGSLTNLKFSKDTPKSLDGFQQLQKIDTNMSYVYSNCLEWLSLFHKEFTLKSLKALLNRAAEKNFFTKYLDSRTEETQKEIIRKLSKLETLEITGYFLFCPITVQFIYQYMTGLQELTIGDIFMGGAQLQVLHNDFLNLVCGLYSCYFNLYIQNEIWHLFTLIKSFYQQLPLHCRDASRVLEFSVDGSSGFGETQVAFRSNKLHNGNVERVVTFFIGEEVTGRHFSTLGIDSLRFFTRDHFGRNYIKMFQTILDNLPDVENVYFKAPRKLDYKEIPKRKHPQVIHLEIQAEKDMGRRYMWNNITGKFPNITSLRLSYFCGVYNKDKKEYLVHLPNAKLDRLHLDISPLWLRASRSAEVTVDYFILDVRAKGQQQLFKVSMGQLSVTKISNSNIPEFTEGEETHLRISVFVDYIQFILMYLYRGSEAFPPLPKDYYFTYYSHKISQTRLYLTWPSNSAENRVQ